MTRRPAPAPGVIIERPDLQTMAQRFGFWTLTFLGWVSYGYLWLPLITFTAWQVDLVLIYQRMIVEGGYLGLIEVLSSYLLVYACLAGLYMGWARYNQWRFSGRERRAARPECPAAAQAESFGVPLKVLEQWRRARRVVVHMDEAGRVKPSDEALVRIRRVAAVTRHHDDPEPRRTAQSGL